MTDTEIREGLALGTLVVVDADQLNRLIETGLEVKRLRDAWLCEGSLKHESPRVMEIVKRLCEK